MGRKGKAAPAVAAPSLLRYLPLAMLLALVVFVGAVLGVFFISPPGAFHYPLAENQSGCVPGQTQPCSVGNCSGTLTCLSDGGWSGCNWERVCTQGVRVPCIQYGCAYAYKTCDTCGSGYGDCSAPASGSG